MARTKHRKGHREALEGFRRSLRTQRHREQAGMRLKGSVRSPKFHLMEKFRSLVARDA